MPGPEKKKQFFADPLSSINLLLLPTSLGHPRNAELLQNIKNFVLKSFLLPPSLYNFIEL